jgi:hypothetical protein
MRSTVEELRAQLRECRAEARFWKGMTGLVVVTFTLLLAFVSGAARLADGGAGPGHEERPGVRPITDEALNGGGIDNRASFPRLRYPAV